MFNDIVVSRERMAVAKIFGHICTFRINYGITLKRIQFGHQRQLVLLHPFNADLRIQVVDLMQGDDISLIGQR